MPFRTDLGSDCTGEKLLEECLETDPRSAVSGDFCQFYMRKERPMISKQLVVKWDT